MQDEIKTINTEVNVLKEELDEYGPTEDLDDDEKVEKAEAREEYEKARYVSICSVRR
jgi:hypothetical protein